MTLEADGCPAGSEARACSGKPSSSIMALGNSSESSRRVETSSNGAGSGAGSRSSNAGRQASWEAGGGPCCEGLAASCMGACCQEGSANQLRSSCRVSQSTMEVCKDNTSQSNVDDSAAMHAMSCMHAQPICVLCKTAIPSCSSADALMLLVFNPDAAELNVCSHPVYICWDVHLRDRLQNGKCHSCDAAIANDASVTPDPPSQIGLAIKHHGSSQESTRCSSVELCLCLWTEFWTRDATYDCMTLCSIARRNPSKEPFPGRSEAHLR